MNSLKSIVILLLFASMPFALSAKENVPANENALANKSTSAKETELRDYSNFFDESLNDMEEEKEIAVEEGKKGILLMFEMDECPFCARMKKTVLNRGKVQDYYREHFRILTVDIEGDLELTDFDGKETTQKAFSLDQFRVRATPVFQFLDLEGKPIKNGRLTGASKDANEFMMLGQYVVDGNNEKMPFLRYKRKQKKVN